MSGAVSGESYINCAEIYRSYLDELKRKEMAPERRAALYRWAQRVYNACETGHLEDPKGLFEKLDRDRH
jgi:hypothetical protein